MQHNVSDVEQALQASYNEYVSAINARDWDKVGSLYTEDAALMFLGRTTTHGRQCKYKLEFLYFHNILIQNVPQLSI